MLNKIRDGKIEHVVLEGDTAAGELVIKGAIIGVAVTDGLTGEIVAVDCEGVFELPKKAADNGVQGALAYWSAGDANVTTTKGDNTLIGHFSEGAGATTEAAQINIG